MQGPAVSVVIPTFNNVDVLKRCLESWRRHVPAEVAEILVIEDGCTDGTPDYLRSVAQSKWGQKCLRIFHEDDVNQLVCNNRGFKEGGAPLFLVWDDDMFVEGDWFVPELLRTLDRYPDIGLVSLIRGLNCFPLRYPITDWQDLHDPQHMQSTVGPGFGVNWFRLAEVDIVVRPWIVRRACLDKVGVLDEAFRPIEWDEADLCCRIRQGGWKVATHCYERLGAFTHLGSSTLAKLPSEKHQRMVLPNGQLFRSRWEAYIGEQHRRSRRTWWRTMSAAGLPSLAGQMLLYCSRRLRKAIRGSRDRTKSLLQVG